MTDNSGPDFPTPAAPDGYFAAEAARYRLRAELVPANKATIFDALAAAGIVAVEVDFDGFGDSGQIESIDARNAEVDVILPAVTVEFVSPSYAHDGVEHRAMPLTEAIETLCYELLGATHCGWENNDGAYGNFVFDVATRVISLDFNGRHTVIDSYDHDF